MVEEVIGRGLHPIPLDHQVQLLVFLVYPDALRNLVKVEPELLQKLQSFRQRHFLYVLFCEVCDVLHIVSYEEQIVFGLGYFYQVVAVIIVKLHPFFKQNFSLGERMPRVFEI